MNLQTDDVNTLSLSMSAMRISFLTLMYFAVNYLKYDIHLIPFLLEGVALYPELNQSDGIHPNEKGTLVISETIRKSILKIKN